MADKKKTVLGKGLGNIFGDEGLDRVIDEQKSIYEISPNSSFGKDLMKFIENLVGV